MNLGLMYFSEATQASDPYKFIMETSKFADHSSLDSVWIPERHFNKVGGIFPNPAVLLAAISMVTSRIVLRTGSLISPLHHDLRIAENFAMVDQLSRGRLEITFGTGWNKNDFSFFPENYDCRRGIMDNQIHFLRETWEKGYSEKYEREIWPKVMQKKIPFWISTSGNKNSYLYAAENNIGVLTHLINQDFDVLKKNIDAYMSAYRGKGRVAVMLHTFVDSSTEKAREVARPYLKSYLREIIELENQAARSGGDVSGNLVANDKRIPDEVLNELLDISVEKYFNEKSLIGDINYCKERVNFFKSLGVTDIACLIDFGIGLEATLSSLEKLSQIRK